MKRKSSTRRIFTGILIMSVVSLLGVNFLKHTAFYKSVDRNFFSFISMVKYGVVDYPIQTISNFAQDVAEMWDVRYENDEIRKELDEAYQLQTYLLAQQEEIESLKNIIGLQKTFTEYVSIPATTISRSTEQWDNVVTIDVGTDHGVAVGDGVVTPHGIIGRIIEVKANQSIVSLIIANNENSNVAVKIEVAEGQYVPGILDSYDEDKNLFAVRLLETSSSVVGGMKVSTSGIGGVYPMGLYVGEVDSVKNIADDIGIRVYVKSDVNFNDLRYVLVVKRP